LFFAFSVKTNAQEQVKIGFYKTGDVQLVVSEPFGGRMPDRGVIGLMVHVSGNVQNCDYIPANLQGKIVVIEAGQCGIIRSAQKAEKAGATAVVIVRSNGDEIIPEGRLISIPCFTVSPTTGGYYRQMLPKPTLVSLSLPNGTAAKTAAKVENLAIDAQTKQFLEQKPAETTTQPAPQPVVAAVAKPVEPPPTPKTVTADPVPAPIITAAPGQPVATTISSASTPVASHDNAPHTNPIKVAPTETVAAAAPKPAENTTPAATPPPENTLVVSFKPSDEPPKTVSSDTPMTKPSSESSKTAIAAPASSTLAVLNQVVAAPVVQETAVTPNISTGVVAEDATAYLKEALEIFPRRTADVTIVNYNFEKKMNLTITLKTDGGQKIKDYKVEGMQFGTVDIEVTHLPNGKYIVMVADEKMSIEQHIIVEH
jgi:hypothetical protein